jgi:hypothetical protein
VLIGVAHTAPACPSTNVGSQTFPKRKKPVLLTCRHFEAASLQLTCDMWILTAPNPAVVPVYSSTDMERRLVRKAHLEEEIG